MPKVNPRESAVTVKLDLKQLKQKSSSTGGGRGSGGGGGASQEVIIGKNKQITNRVKINPNTNTKKTSIQDLMMQEALAAVAAVATTSTLLDDQIGMNTENVDIHNIVPQPSTSKSDLLSETQSTNTTQSTSNITLFPSSTTSSNQTFHTLDDLLALD
jgi:hypothetical protein